MGIYSSIATGVAGWMAALSMAGVTAVTGAAAVVPSQPVASHQTSVQCITLTRNLSFGSRDASFSGEVSALQNFLISQGVLQVGATGYFGPLTLGAVKQFQARNGVPSTGFVGALTRAAMLRLGCGANPQSNVTIYSMNPTYGPTGTQVSITGFGFTNDNTILFGNGAIVHVPISSSRAIACTTDPSCHGGINQTLTFTVPAALNPLCYYSGCMQPSWQTTPGNYGVSVMNSNGTSNAMTFTVSSGSSTSNPTISSIWPASGSTGTQVTVYGSGFTSNDVVLIGNGAIRYPSIGSNGTQLTFTLPDGVGPYCAPGMMCPMYLQLLTPGSYQISVKDESTGSVSNSVAFTITSSGSSYQGLSITGLDAPATLPVGSVGSWTVHASVTSGSSTNLHYSVVWGDQNSVNSAQIVQPTGATTQTSSTFTHAYQATGTYTPVFTVSNDSGQSLNVSASVTVTPLY